LFFAQQAPYPDETALEYTLHACSAYSGAGESFQISLFAAEYELYEKAEVTGEVKVVSHY
jgi:hypothetical protein